MSAENAHEAVGPMQQIMNEFNLKPHAEGGHGERIFEVIDLHPVNNFIHSLNLPIDITINKAVVMLWLSAIMAFALIYYAGHGRGLVAKGLKNAMEAIFQFVKLDIIEENLGHAGKSYLPFVGGLFFFILCNNLLGLIPSGFSAGSNLSVTATLAIMVLIVIIYTGMKNQGLFRYWINLAPSGLPKPLYILMYPIEFISLLAKPFSLSVRLFANLLAGHIVIYSLLALSMLFGLWLAPVSLAVATAIYAFEIFVAFMQAYIFTILTSVYLGQALHSDH